MPNIGENKFSASGDSPKWVKSKRRKRKREERPKGMAHAKPPGPMYQNQRKICQLPLRMLIFGMQPYFEYFFIAPSPPSKPLKV